MTATAEEIQEKINANRREEVRETFKQELASRGLDPGSGTLTDTPHVEPNHDIHHEARKSDIKGIGHWVTKDSGKRAEFESGMCRDTDEGKTRYWRTAVGPMLKRWALLLGRGAVKYPDEAAGVPNWTLANGDAELQRFKESAFDHFMQWFYGEDDEDHAAAVFFNLNGAEYVKAKLDSTTGTS